MKQTAVEWLVDQLKEYDFSPRDNTYLIEIPVWIWKEKVEKAKQMEKEQMFKALIQGKEVHRSYNIELEFNEYYNETYESKESDAKDVVLGYKTSLDAQMLDRIEPKQETLEEAAERVFKKHSNNTSLAEGYYDYMMDEEDFKEASLEINKWQQERMYSEEDMAEAFIACWKANVPDGIECKVSFNEWFNQFKKK
jgi:predicted nucleic acid-binding protein